MHGWTLLKPIWSSCIRQLTDSTTSAATGKHYCSMEAEIAKYNCLTNRKDWKNANKKKWCTSSWEFAKCFIYASGYKNKNAIEEVDLNALLNIIKNCKQFEKYVASSSVLVLDNVSCFYIQFCQIKLTVKNVSYKGLHTPK